MKALFLFFALFVTHISYAMIMDPTEHQDDPTKPTQLKEAREKETEIQIIFNPEREPTALGGRVKQERKEKEQDKKSACNIITDAGTLSQDESANLCENIWDLSYPTAIYLEDIIELFRNVKKRYNYYKNKGNNYEIGNAEENG